LRERLRLSDLHVMFVCMDQHQTPLSRRALIDAATFRNTGGNALLVCSPGSPIDVAAERQDIPRYPLDAPLDWRSLWTLYKLTRQLVARDGLDIVHCYNYRALLALGPALKGEAKIPLVFTCNENIVQAYSPFWHDYCVTRVDQVLTFAPTLAEQIAETLPLGPRKVAAMGAGLERIRYERPTPTTAAVRIGAFVPGDATDVHRIRPLLHALPGLEHSSHGKLILELITDRSWYEHELYPSLKHTVLERGLEHNVAFYPVSLAAGGLQGQDLYVGLSEEDPFDDVELRALLMGIPLLLPRTSARTELLNSSQFGLTYAPGDVRELKAKALEMLGRKQEFVDALKLVQDELWEKHQHEAYYDQLFLLYERLVLQRLRFALKRRTPFVSKA
jgi:hypothetical protein